MEIRSIVCPSDDAIALLRAWMPEALVASSRFYCPTSLSDVPSTAIDILYLRKLQTLVIQDVHSIDLDVIDDREERTKDVLMLQASSEQFEVVIVAPTFFIMLFETKEIFKTVFGDRATEYWYLMGTYDPERAIREAGINVTEIIDSLDNTTLERLRCTPTAQRILDAIETLDVKPFAHEKGGDYAVHRRPPQMPHWD